VKEADFHRAVVELARLLGWEVFHVQDSRREVRRRGVSLLVGDEMARGWPDLVLAHPRWRALAVRELKTDQGRLTPAQRRWLTVLRLCGLDADVWRPRDWRQIERFLQHPHRTLSGPRTRRGPPP
jgi:hypothetical protein